MNNQGPKLEPRYFVMKMSDIHGALNSHDIRRLNEMMRKVIAFRAKRGQTPMECVVIEADWPEYPIIAPHLLNRIRAEREFQMRKQNEADAARDN